MVYAGIHEVIYGGGDQSLVHVPQIPVDDGEATYIVEDTLEHSTTAGRIIVASASAVVDDFSATTVADAGPEETDARRIEVDDSAGAQIGRFYALVSPEGIVQRFRCAGVDVGVIIAEAPLGQGRNFASGSEVLGLELRGTFPSAAASNATLFEQDRPLRATWTYSLRGVTVTEVQQLRVSRTRVSEANIAAVQHDLEMYWPELVKEYSGNLTDVVEFAARRVVMRLRKRHVDVGQFMLGDAMHEAILSRAVFHLADQGISPGGRTSDEFRDQMKAKYVDDVGMLLNGRASRDQVEVTRAGDQATASHSKRWSSITTRP